jgi:hypothetical protein
MGWGRMVGAYSMLAAILSENLKRLGDIQEEMAEQYYSGSAGATM